VSGATTQTVYVQDHEARAAADLPIARRGSRWTAAARAVGRGVQRLEDAAWSLLVDTGLSSASGAVLDRLGSYVGEPRGPFTDDVYRRFIGARILANRSDGTPEAMLAILARLTEPSEVEYFGTPPAGFVIQVTRTEPMLDSQRRRIRRIVGDARPLGVGVDLILVIDRRFGFDEDPLSLGFDLGPFAEVL
jgi:hypothetical protein